MTMTSEGVSAAGSGWRKLAVLVLALVVIGLPVNALGSYALLLVATLVIFTGETVTGPRAWAAAGAVVAVTVAGQLLLAPPRIDEGFNVFVVDGPGGALQRELPADTFRQMLAEFDRRYPPDRRCDPKAGGCWRGEGFPDRAYAFSGDGIFDRTAASRRITRLSFTDPIWHNLGVINDVRFNWFGPSDIERNRRAPWWHVLRPWHLLMPYFVMFRLPADFIGSQLCWQGEVLWEDAGERFAALQHADFSCRTVEPSDVNRRIFGVSIAAPLAMRLDVPMSMQLRRLAAPALMLIGVGAVLILLVRWRPRRMALPLLLIVLALIVVLLNDASFIGGVRPFDGGDDGLFSESAGRRIVQYVLASDFGNALRGDEDVFWNLPGLRYLRALELFVFGDTNFGYLSLMLAMPLWTYGLFRRFLSERWVLAIVVMFIAIPIGAIFGSSYFQYVKWAARGFSDPGAAVFLLAGLLVLVSAPAIGTNRRFIPAFGAGFLFFLAVFMRPNLAPFAAVMLGGAGLAALVQAQVFRLAGLCLGFLPVVSMAIHNWYFGHVFVLFGANSTWSGNLPTPPAIYLSALGELVRLDLSGKDIAHVVVQLAGWLAGPAESYWTIPLNAVAVVVVVFVLLRGRAYDPWLRLLAGATLAGHTIALFYRPFGRYYYITWLLTFLVCAVWAQTEGAAAFRQKFPAFVEWLTKRPAWQSLARALDRAAAAAG